MSIAVSVCISPSRCHAFILSGMAALFLLTGILISVNCVGSYDAVVKWIVASLFVLAGIFLVCRCLRSRKTLCIDISGNGQIRLQEYRGYRSGAARDKADLAVAGGEVLAMAENSIIWSWLLILCLVSDSGRIVRVPVFFDSMKPGEFRALYTTCRWLSVHRKE